MTRRIPFLRDVNYASTRIWAGLFVLFMLYQAMGFLELVPNHDHLDENKKFHENYGDNFQDRIVRFLADTANDLGVSITPYSGTLIAALRFGFIPPEMNDDIDFVVQCRNPNTESQCMKDVEKLGKMCLEKYPEEFKKYMIDFRGKRMKIELHCIDNENCPKDNIVHLHVIHETDSTLSGYSHIKPEALMNQETCFLSGREFKCSASAILMLLNIGHWERFGKTCPLFPDYGGKQKDGMRKFVQSTRELHEAGYASFMNLLTNEGKLKLEQMQDLYYGTDRFDPPLAETFTKCDEKRASGIHSTHKF